MPEQTIQNPDELKGDTTNQHKERRNVYAELKAGQDRARQDMEKKKISLQEFVTKPESRRYYPNEEFCFLVHAPLDIPSRTSQLGTEHFIQTDRPLNTSLIDQEHTTTFEGMSGLIIEPPNDENDVLGTWPYDSGYNDMSGENVYLDPKQLLTETRRDNYNQVNIRTGKVIGVFIRVKSNGDIIGDQQRAEQLRTFAHENNLPITEIVIEPQKHHDEPVAIHQPTEDLTTLEFASQGNKFRIDALVANPSRLLPGDTPTNGYYFRARKIDEYGATSGDVSDKESLSIIVNTLKQSFSDSIDLATKQVIQEMIQYFTGLSAVSI